MVNCVILRYYQYLNFGVIEMVDNSKQITKGRKYKRLQPPAGLGIVEQRIWHMVVESVPPQHFAECDTPILVSFCQMYVLHQRANQELMDAGIMTLVAANGAVSMHPMVNAVTKFAGALGQLSTKLRIVPQARLATKEKASNPEFEGEKETDGDSVDDLFMH